MFNNTNLRNNLEKIQAKSKADREWWDKEKASIQSKFMEELENEKAPAEGSKGTPSAAAAANSDEDAVLVEGGGPAASGSAAGSKGGTKKRKGKK